MTCPKPGCGARAGHDVGFNRDMVLYGLPQRRVTCVAGHSTTFGTEAALKPPERVWGQYATLEGQNHRRLDGPLEGPGCLLCLSAQQQFGVPCKRHGGPGFRALVRGARAPRVAPGDRTHCPRGHAYDETNTVWRDGRRNCRECRRAQQREYRRQAKGRAVAV